MNNFTLVAISAILISFLVTAILFLALYAVCSIGCRFETKYALKHIKNTAYDHAGLTQYEKAINNDIKYHAKALLDKSKISFDEISKEFTNILSEYKDSCIKNPKTHKNYFHSAVGIIDLECTLKFLKEYEKLASKQLKKLGKNEQDNSKNNIKLNIKFQLEKIPDLKDSLSVDLKRYTIKWKSDCIQDEELSSKLRKSLDLYYLKNGRDFSYDLKDLGFISINALSQDCYAWYQDVESKNKFQCNTSPPKYNDIEQNPSANIKFNESPPQYSEIPTK